MSTWHQDRARPRPKLYHAVDWTVVSNPPHETLTLYRCGTEAQANAHLEGLRRHGNGDHSYVLPPRAAPFDCVICGQHITDGKPCGCGARVQS